MTLPSTMNLSRDDAHERSARLTVAEYHVRLDLSSATDPGEPTFGTTTTVRFSSSAPATFLDFLGEVSSVVVNDEVRDAAAAYDGARVRLDGLAAQNVVTVTGRARYSRSGEGLHRFTDPVDGQTYLYTQYEPADARRVFATFEQPDLKGVFRFEVVAPTGWEVLSNQPATEVAAFVPPEGHPRTATPGPALHLSRWAFAATPPMSTYLTAVVAGPYQRFAGTWSATLPDGGTLEVPLGVLCRASLATHLDADGVLEVTRQGLDFFHREFAFPYPWGKYDQVFVPEYNLGAMENPGCVTFTESYVYRSAATRAQYQGRANTILHEMAHMWFGDLVTPRWWDDLWLKESFADYMGAAASVAATEYTDAWVSFANRRKAWAYLQDQLPTTHPVVADIPDLEAAKQNFDGITYAKGASVLKQLVAYVGEEAFFEGARRYFRRHAYGSTTLPDLLAALEESSGRDLAAWSRLWLETAGTSTLHVERTSEAGRLTRLVVVQDAVDPVTGHEVPRPHRLAVGLYSLLRDDDGVRLARTQRIELDVDGARTEVGAAVGLPEPDLVLLNDDDLTYAKIRLDDGSLQAVTDHLGALAEPLPRSLVWSALWNACRDALLPARAYVDLVLRHGAGETDSAVLDGLVGDVAAAIERYAPATDRERLRETWTAGAHDRLLAADPGDAQLVWARAFARAGATVPGAATALRAVLGGAVPGLPLDPELRWALWQALAATGDASRAELDAEQERDRTADGATQHLAAVSSLPEAELRAWSWATVHTPAALTNDHVDATITGLTQPLHRDLGAPFTEQYFQGLRRTWAEHSIEIAGRLVRGLYPGRQDLDGAVPEEHPAVVRTDRWLTEEADAPAALRRLVVEARDHLLRALRAQEAAARLP